LLIFGSRFLRGAKSDNVALRSAKEASGAVNFRKAIDTVQILIR